MNIFSYSTYNPHFLQKLFKLKIKFTKAYIISNPKSSVSTTRGKTVRKAISGRLDPALFPITMGECNTILGVCTVYRNLE